MDNRKSISPDKLPDSTIITPAGVIPPQLELNLRTEQDKKYTLMKKFEETKHNKQYLDNDQGCI